MRRGILFLSFLILGTFFFSAGFARAAGPTIIADNTHITTSTTWEKSKSPYLVKGTVYVQAPLTIEPGTVVKLEYKKGDLEIYNNFSAVGTKKDRIVFTSSRDDSFGGDTNGDGGATTPAKGDWLGVNFTSAGTVKEVEYASILYGGGANWASAAVIINNNDMVSLRKSEVKYSSSHGVMMIGTPPATVEENTISNNDYCGIYASIGGRTAVIKYNSIFGNKICGAKVFQPEYGTPKDRLDARDNWWGNASGPQYRSNFGWPDNRNGTGDQISDGVLFDPWQGKNTNIGLDPVIIIPGIMGSATKYLGGLGELKIDPILHTYDNLIATLEKNGYKGGENLFEFPYEWRDSNIQTAQKLKEKIEEIKTKTGRPKVDLVAHSMGGLIARYYIEGENYGNDVDQLITLGTPHKGSPKSYLTWEAGEIGTKFDDNIIEGIFKIEANHSGYNTLKDYIQGRVISAKELLPDYDYLKKASSGEMRNYPNNYPKNTFLEFLNSTERLKKLNNIEFINIIGDTRNNNTMEKLRVTNSDREGIWEHGMPENYYNNNTDQGIEYGQGDETVPFLSAEEISSNKEIILNSSHGNLPTKAQCDVFMELTGNKNCKEASIFDRVTDILTFSVFSPVDIQIESPSGKRMGKNFETGEEFDEIKGAFYTGYDTKNEFITIPNPEDGEYKILTEGTGTGEYTIETAKITENETTGEADESVATITGMAAPQVQEENKVEVDEGGVKKVEPLTLSPKNKEEKKSVEETGIVLGASQDQNLQKDSEKEKSVDQPQDRILQLDALKGMVRQYFETNQIKSRKEAKKITQILNGIRVYFKKYEASTSQKKLKNYKRKANRDIERLIARINKEIPKTIFEEAGNSLVENLNSLKIVI